MKRRLYGGALVIILVLSLFTPLAPQASAAERSQTFRELGYNDTTTRTINGTASFYFPLPSGQTPATGSRVELVFSHSPLLIPERSTLTVVAAGQSLASVFLDNANQNRATLNVPLPTANFTGTGYLIELQFHMRLTRDECEENSNPALWATVHSDSRLVLNTQVATPGPQLSQLPTIFIPPAPKPEAQQASPKTYPPTLAMVLPANASPEELEAAGLVAYGAGQWAATVDRDPVIEVVDRPGTERPTIIIGQGSTLPDLGTTAPLRWTGQDFSTKNGAIPGTMGALGLGQTANGVPQLVVTGGSPATVRTAASALVTPAITSLLTGDTLGLTGNKASGGTPVPPWRDGAASFAQLGFEKIQMAGSGAHTIDLAFERPAGWILRDGGTLDLQVSSSAALRADTSWIAVSINGTDIGSQRLTGGENGRYHFNLPNGVFNTNAVGGPVRHFALQIRMLLDLPEERCLSLPPDEGAWLTVQPTSAFSLPYEQAGGLDLARFPYPLTNSSKEGVAVVLPQQPTPADLTAGLALVSTLGRHSPAGVSADRLPLLVTADRLSPTDQQGRHLILLGGPERNSQSAAAAQKNADLFAQAQPAVYRPGAGDPIGVVRIAQSPFSNNYTVVAVSGNSPEGLQLAAKSLLYADPVSQLRGKAVVVVPGVAPQMITPADNPGTPPAALAPQVNVPLKDRIASSQVIGIIAFVALLLVLLLLIGARFRRRRAS